MMKKNCNFDVDFKKIISVAFIVLTGVFIGTLINAYLSINNPHLPLIFINSLFRLTYLITISFSLILFIFYFGLSAFGQPIVLFLMLVYGGLLGFISSTMFLMYNLAGFKINALFLTPYLILHSSGMILLATNSINMSSFISELVLCDGIISNKKESFKIYFSKTLLLSIIIFSSFAFKAIIYYLFK